MIKNTKFSLLYEDWNKFMLSKFNHNINERLLDANNLLVLGAAKSSSKSTMTLLQSMNKKMSQIIAKS